MVWVDVSVECQSNGRELGRGDYLSIAAAPRDDKEPIRVVQCLHSLAVAAAGYERRDEKHAVEKCRRRSHPHTDGEKEELGHECDAHNGDNEDCKCAIRHGSIRCHYEAEPVGWTRFNGRGWFSDGTLQTMILSCHGERPAGETGHDDPGSLNGSGTPFGGAHCGSQFKKSELEARAGGWRQLERPLLRERPRGLA